MKELAIHPVFEGTGNMITHIARLRNKAIQNHIFNRSLNGSAEQFSNRRISHHIYSEVMVAADAIPERLDIGQVIEDRLQAGKWRILFLARLHQEEGLYETIEAFAILRQRYPMLELVIAGEGREISQARQVVEERSIPNVIFTASVGRTDALNLFRNTHVLCSPAYSEEIPDTIKEAMAAGLPVVARMTGGIRDFFMNGEHGFATACKAPRILAGHIEQLLLDPELWRSIALFNYQYARANFPAETGRTGRLQQRTTRYHFARPAAPLPHRR